MLYLDDSMPEGWYFFVEEEGTGTAGAEYCTCRYEVFELIDDVELHDGEIFKESEAPESVKVAVLAQHWFGRICWSFGDGARFSYNVKKDRLSLRFTEKDGVVAWKGKLTFIDFHEAVRRIARYHLRHHVDELRGSSFARRALIWVLSERRLEDLYDLSRESEFFWDFERI